MYEFKTTDGQVLDIIELTWDKARKLLIKMIPDLVKIIDKISPSSEYKLYKVKYPFGATIFDKNESYLPTIDGNHVSFNDPSLPKALIKNLSYNPETSNPVGIVLDKFSEFYLTVGNRIMPYSIVKPGELIGLARILDNADNKFIDSKHLSFFMWELTSGARSILMLPKITENISYSRLKKAYDLTIDKPQNYENHWEVFREIAQKSNSEWKSEFLFFSNNWFSKLEDVAWIELYNYFLNSNRRSYGYWRNILSWQITFNMIEQERNLRLSSYTLDTAKHLFAIASGVFPGFEPATDDNSAPIALIKDAYINEYGLANYYPTIMQPAHFNLDSNNPVYYSINYPTLAQCDPQAFTGKSAITLLDQLQHVIKTYKSSIAKNEFARATSLYTAAELVNFSYYHSDPESYTNINSTDAIAQEDERFLNNTSRTFPKISSFLRGCVKISKKTNL